MARDKTTARKVTKPAPKKALAVSKPPIQKKTTDKGKGKATSSDAVVVHYVRMSRGKTIFGFTSLDEETRFLMYPPSNRQEDLNLDTPPSSPDRGNVFTDPKPYPFGVTPAFLTPGSSSRHSYFRDTGRRPVPTLYPDVDTLRQLGMDLEVVGLMRASGLYMLFADDPGTYTDPVLEFMSSFKPIEEKGQFVAWRFELGGILWDVCDEVLREWFRFPAGGVFTYYPEAERLQAIWHALSGRDFTEKHHHSSKIRDPVWWVIHKFISCCFFVRDDKGRFAQKLELSVMSYMREGRTVDWLPVLTNGLLENQKKSANKTMGGGSFVTKLALKLRFTLRGGRASTSSLTIQSLIARQMLKADRTWRIDDHAPAAAQAPDVPDHVDPADDQDALASDPVPADPSSVPSTSAPASDEPGPSAPSTQPPPVPSGPDFEATVLAMMRSMQSRMSSYEETQAILMRDVAEILAIIRGPTHAPGPSSFSPAYSAPPHVHVPTRGDDPELGMTIEDIDACGDITPTDEPERMDADVTSLGDTEMGGDGDAPAAT